MSHAPSRLTVPGAANFLQARFWTAFGSGQLTRSNSEMAMFQQLPLSDLKIRFSRDLKSPGR